MKLIWAKETADDIQRLIDFLIDKNPEAAAKAIQSIDEKADLLLEFPEIGPRMNDDSKRRELIVPFGASAYVLRYCIVNDHIVILRVWHCRETRT